MKNYRSVSNLTFISKVIEKVISGRLNEHLINNSLFHPLQSAYRDKHSTETVLIKVQNGILSALDAGSSAILLMLDLSAAFDTIDHDILLSRLCNVYGITGNALDWFRSYLTGRIQRVVIEDSVSVDKELDFGVPQGSVLGPIIYCMYTKPVSDIIQRHGLSHHSYADDTQLYMTMDHWFQRLPPARGGTAQRKILHLANWSQLIHPGPASSMTKFFLVSSQSCVSTLPH